MFKYKLNLNPWAYKNGFYIFGICVPRRLIWVLLEVCTTTRTKTVWAEKKIYFWRFLFLFLNFQGYTSFLTGGRTDLQKYSNCSSWRADSKYINEITVDLMVQEISLSKVCCVNCDKTFDATRLLSVAVHYMYKFKPPPHANPILQKWGKIWGSILHVWI